MKPISRWLLSAALAVTLIGPAALAQDPAPDPAPDPAQEAKKQLFADQRAGEALELIRQDKVADVMSGLEILAKTPSKTVTREVLDTVLLRIEQHVAEFAGYALAQNDPEGAIAICTEQLAKIPKKGATRRLRQLCGVLSELPKKSAVPLLVSNRLLRSRNVEVRREALRALGWHRAPEVLQAAISALGAKDPHVRNAACVALGRLGDKKAVMPLLSQLDKKDGGTAGFAAIALGRIEDDRIFPSIASRVGSGNSLDKGKALVAAARAKHVEQLTSMASRGSSEIRIPACAALAKLKIQDLAVQRALLGSMLDGNDRWVQAAAFHALGQCANPELAPYLSKRMGQKARLKRMYVYEIAGDIGAASCLPYIKKTMWGEKDDILRRVAMDAFWRIRDPEAITACEAKIRKSTGRNLGRAAELLGLRRNRNGFELALELIQRHRDGSKEQYAFERTLEMQTGHFFGPDVKIWNEWMKKNDKFFEKEQAVVEREKWREDFLKENKGPRVTPKTEEAVQAALDYLARHQNGSGAFDQQHYLKNCEEDEPCPTGDGARVQMEPIGTTALCTLTYFGAGCSPNEGRYRGVLARAMEYMLSRQQANGDYTPNDLIGGYNRPLALQAYAEAAIASGSDELLPFIQRGVDFLACIQAKKGGWRYRVVDNANDTSVVSWVLFASKAAEKAGVKVRHSIYEGSDMVLWRDQTHPTKVREDFIKDIDPRYEFEVGLNTDYVFHTGYQDSKFTKNQATTALGLMSRILLGYRRSHPFCIGSANMILEKQLPPLPKNLDDWSAFSVDAQYPMYFMYYGTVSTHQMGGRYFRKWNERIKQILPNTQRTKGCRRGSWPGWRLDGIFGSLYTTAMGALTLETYYRYAPILQD